MSQARARSAIHRREILTVQTSDCYVIDAADLSTAAHGPAVRPMGPRILADLLDAFDDRPIDDQQLDSVVRHRLGRHLEQVRGADNSPASTTPWSVDRGVRHSGASAPQSQIMAVLREPHGSLFTDEPEHFLRDHYLAESPGATILLM